MGNRFATPALASVCLVAFLACGGSSKKDTTKGVTKGDTSTTIPKVDPTLCETKGKKIVTFDLNRDEKPDVWKLYKNIKEGGANVEILTCKQVDLDHDGRKDYVVAFNRKGGMIFEKFDFTFDGKFDAFARYDEKTGTLYQVQRDSDFDGKYDITEMYDDNGVLESVRRDRNGDKKPDVWEQFEKGQLVAILYDDDFDGKVDRREEVADKKKKPGKALPKPDMPKPDDKKPAGGDAKKPAAKK